MYIFKLLALWFFILLAWFWISPFGSKSYTYICLCACTCALIVCAYIHVSVIIQGEIYFDAKLLNITFSVFVADLPFKFPSITFEFFSYAEGSGQTISLHGPKKNLGTAHDRQKTQKERADQNVTCSRPDPIKTGISRVDRFWNFGTIEKGDKCDLLPQKGYKVGKVDFEVLVRLQNTLQIDTQNIYLS